ERQHAEERLQVLADHDPVTGVFNRRRFSEELERWLAFSRRYDSQGAVLVIDVDNFKEINDAFGHAIGDQALEWVGALLRNRVRNHRGDELVVPDARIVEPQVRHQWFLHAENVARRDPGLTPARGARRLLEDGEAIHRLINSSRQPGRLHTLLLIEVAVHAED